MKNITLYANNSNNSNDNNYYILRIVDDSSYVASVDTRAKSNGLDPVSGCADVENRSKPGHTKQNQA